MKKEREGLWQAHGVSVITESMSNPDMEHTHKWFVQNTAHHTNRSSARWETLRYRQKEIKWMQWVAGSSG